MEKNNNNIFVTVFSDLFSSKTEKCLLFLNKIIEN